MRAANVWQSCLNGMLISRVSKNEWTAMAERKEELEHSGLTFDSFLEQDGIRKDVEAVAAKRVQAWQREQATLEEDK